ncbi:MAG TPA: caspase family protein [Polyangiaceae bacterium]|nr:caspase family protein [Polyangiaceae bacterium]
MKALALTCALIILTLVVRNAGAESLADNRFVVVVGANVGTANDDPLRYAESDAERFRDLLVELGGVPAERAFLLLGGKPEGLWRVLSEVRGRVAELSRMGRSSTVVFYFSGHGDGEALHLPSGLILLSDLRRELAAVPARLQITMLDACRTGGRVKGVTRGPSVQVALGPEGPHGTVELRASSEGEAAQESEELEGAIFTHFLVSGMRGAADTDGDGGITLSELYSYTFRRTLLRSGTAQVLQHPELAVDLSGAGEVVLTRPKLASATLDVPANPGRYLIFAMPSSRVVGELSGIGASRLAVPQSRLLVVRRQGEDTRVAEPDLTMGGSRTLGEADFRPVAREQLVTRGGRLALRSLQIEEAVGFEWASQRAETAALSTALRLSYLGSLEYALDARFVAGNVAVGHYFGDARAIGLSAMVGVRTVWGDRARMSVGIGPEVRVSWQHLDERTGIANEDHTFTEIGPRAALRFGMPVGHDITVSGEAAFTPLFRREHERDKPATIAVHAVLAGNVGFGYAF